ALSALAARPRRRLQGDSHGRGRRRNLRRLHDFQGSEASTLLVEIALVVAPRGAREADLPVPAGAAAPVARADAGVLQGPPGRSGRPVFFAPAAVAVDVPAEAALLAGDARGDARLRRRL